MIEFNFSVDMQPSNDNEKINVPSCSKDNVNTCISTDQNIVTPRRSKRNLKKLDYFERNGSN